MISFYMSENSSISDGLEVGNYRKREGFRWTLATVALSKRLRELNDAIQDLFTLFHNVRT